MVELLAPAGNIEALDAAIGEGADAVYLGLKSFNARLRTSNFSWNQFEAAVHSLHKMGKKIYVTVNTVCQEDETERLYRFLSYLNRVGPDGLIVQDYAVIRMAHEFFPNLELHASTQMNIENASGVNLLSKEGFKRVVLARELGLEEIQQIKSKTNTQLEVFVHGALCISESGLCLFSSYLGGKSANRGMCTQACRRFYTADITSGSEQGYYFSPSDLQLIDRIPDLIEAGVDSFKIEGRMKSAEYVGTVVSAYRYLIDHYEQDKKGSIAAAKRILATDFARSKTSYWYDFKSIDEGMKKSGQSILNPKQAGGTGIYLGKISLLKSASIELKDALQKAASTPEAKELARKTKLAVIRGGSYEVEVGDSIRIHKQDDTGRLSHKIRTIETDEDGINWIDIPGGFSVGDSVYLLQTKSMSKRYKRVLPNDLSTYRKQPADEKLPILDITPVAKKELSYFPEGLYIQVSNIADIFIVQSAHPVRVIIELNSETSYDLLNNKTVIPLSKKQLIISLDPFLPEGIVDETEKTIDTLIEKGFTTWIVNNIGQINFLKGKNVSMIAGPYLYTFNRWAVSWLENQNIGAFISPFENSKRNLLETYERVSRDRVLTPIFVYPSLFRIRFQLPESYDFASFKDKEGMNFKVNTSRDGTFILPDEPFSIIDKTETLIKEGLKRYLIDFSKVKVNKADFKRMLTAMVKRQPLTGTSKFNWKDGFYSVEQMEQYKAGNERAAEERRRNSEKENPFQKKGKKPLKR